MDIRLLLVIIICVLSCSHKIFGQRCARGYVDSGDVCDECGISISSPNTNILKAIDHSWPSHAFIVRKTNTGSQIYICSGTVINRQTILTAASCLFKIKDAEKTTLSVYLGLNDMKFLRHQSEMPKYGVKVDVQDIKVHESYNLKYSYNDIALLILSQPIEFNDYIRPACLPYWENNYYSNGHQISAVEVDISETYLKNTHLTVTVSNTCFGLSQMIFCAKRKKKCNEINGIGGGGGGVYKLEKGLSRYVLSGLASNTIRCKEEHWIFTRTAKYINWITKNWKLLDKTSQKTNQTEYHVDATKKNSVNFSKEDSVNIGTIVGAVFGAILGIVVPVGLIVLLVKQKRAKNVSTKNKQHEIDNATPVNIVESNNKKDEAKDTIDDDKGG